MKKQFKVFTQCNNPGIQSKAASLGYANMVMFMCGRSSRFQMRTLQYWLTPAIDHKQILFLFDSAASPIGYVTWAHLAQDTEQRLLTDANFLLHVGEWNEGGRTWIIDFCFPFGGAREAVNVLKGMFREAGIDKVFWARRQADYSIRKTLGYTL